MPPELPRGFGGEARRERPLFHAGPVPPFHATVTVTPVGTHPHVSFEVLAEWTGPPPAFAQADERPGLRQDVYSADEPGLAKAIAQRALEQLGRGLVPDLRALAGTLRSRLILPE